MKQGRTYGFWSGFGSDIGEVVLIGAVIGMYRKHNCHVKGCWRIARHPVEGTTFVVCRRHHPDDKPTHQDVLDAHQASRRLASRRSKSDRLNEAKEK